MTQRWFSAEKRATVPQATRSEKSFSILNGLYHGGLMVVEWWDPGKTCGFTVLLGTTFGFEATRLEVCKRG